MNVNNEHSKQKPVVCSKRIYILQISAPAYDNYMNHDEGDQFLAQMSG